MKARMCAVVATFASCATAFDGLPPGFFAGIGDLPGGAVRSQAYAVSADGSAVVGWGATSNGTEAFHWRNGVLTNLGDLPGGAVNAEARAVSADGNTVFGFSGDATGDRVFRWQGVSMSAVAGIAPAPSRIESARMGASDDGSTIVGRALVLTPGSHYEAYRHQGGVQTLLGTFFGGYSDALATSGDGSVVVGNTRVAGDERAYRWQNGAAIALPLAAGQSNAWGFDVSHDGGVVVGTLWGSGANQAFRWENGQTVPLGDLPGGNFASAGNAVSADGRVVVGTGTDDFVGPVATVWSAAQGMRSIFRILQDDFGVNMTGWRLTEALDCSADGRVIVGNGFDPLGRQTGWVAVIPSPASWTAVAMVLLLGARHRER